MSIIERSNPLNLQYNICLVTSASSPLGVRVCKSLLKANALVLGIDNTERDPTLNAGLGTHFQFEECDITDGSTAAKVVAAAKEKFGLARIDVLVNVVDHSHQKDLSGFQKLTEEATAAMKLQGKGSVITLTNDVESDPSAELVRYRFFRARCEMLMDIRSTLLKISLLNTSPMASDAISFLRSVSRLKP